MYSDEAQRTIRIIEEEYNLKWSDKEALKKLTQLTLITKEIKDISPIKELKNLTNLNLWDNQIIDISSLRDLINLTNLDLSYNKISDITPLKELKNLIILLLEQNRLVSIVELNNLDNLRDLDLSSNEIIDISFLKYLTNLIKLKLHNNEIRDISSLKELKNLTNLDISSNKIIDISPLKYLTNLTKLNLHNNQIKDISSLKELKNLRDLDLSSNKIIDMSPLKYLGNLNEYSFYAGGNPIVDKILKDLEKEAKEANKLNKKDINYSVGIKRRRYASNKSSIASGDKGRITFDSLFDRIQNHEGSGDNVGGDKIRKSVKVDGNNQGIINTGNGNTILYNYEKKTDYSEQLKTILAGLPIGNIIFDAPKDIYYDEKKDVILRISKNVILTDDLSKENQIVKDNVKISPFMKARLLSDDFKINTLNNEEQIIDDSDFTEWKWSISPEEKLEKDGILRLRITIRIPIDIHREELKDMPIFEKTIAIYVKKAKIWKFF
jgi:Leucine-rich repeat (LRR) protein